MPSPMKNPKNPAVYSRILKCINQGEQLLSILIDPDKFDSSTISSLMNRLPKAAQFIFVGGSRVKDHITEIVVKQLKLHTTLPIVLFPGDVNQITPEADALLFLSLISGQNPEFLINQQVKSISKLRNSPLEIIPTGYILIDGGSPTSVTEVSQTRAIPQHKILDIVDIALAGEFSGKRLIYLEAGSGAKHPVSPEIISAVKEAISLPLIVGGGIKYPWQMQKAYKAGADMIVMGNAFE